MSSHSNHWFGFPEPSAEQKEQSRQRRERERARINWLASVLIGDESVRSVIPGEGGIISDGLLVVMANGTTFTLSVNDRGSVAFTKGE